MSERILDQALRIALRAVQVRAAVAVASGRIAPADRDDVEQDAFIALWAAVDRYDASRASIRTFLERVADKRFASLLRSRVRVAVEQIDARRFPTADGIPAVQLHVDVERILAPLDDADRTLALLLIDHGPTEISRILGVARSTVYDRIARLRQAFRNAGYGPGVAR